MVRIWRAFLQSPEPAQTSSKSPVATHAIATAAAISALSRPLLDPDDPPPHKPSKSVKAMAISGL